MADVAIAPFERQRRCNAGARRGGIMNAIDWYLQSVDGQAHYHLTSSCIRVVGGSCLPLLVSSRQVTWLLLVINLAPWVRQILKYLVLYICMYMLFDTNYSGDIVLRALRVGPWTTILIVSFSEHGSFNLEETIGDASQILWLIDSVYRIGECM